MPTQWRASLQQTQKYWQSYGGLKGLLHSPYCHIAIVLTLLTAGFWRDNNWWQHNLSILPNLLGFTLGGLAVFLCIGDENLKIAMMISDDGDITKTPYMRVISSFVHFTMMQASAITIGILANAANSTTKPDFLSDNINDLLSLALGFVGYWLFLYSLLLTLALALTIYKISSLSTKAAQKTYKNN